MIPLVWRAELCVVLMLAGKGNDSGDIWTLVWVSLYRSFPRSCYVLHTEHGAPGTWDKGGCHQEEKASERESGTPLPLSSSIFLRPILRSIFPWISCEMKDVSCKLLSRTVRWAFPPDSIHVAISPHLWLQASALGIWGAGVGDEEVVSKIFLKK